MFHKFTFKNAHQAFSVARITTRTKMGRKKLVFSDVTSRFLFYVFATSEHATEIPTFLARTWAIVIRY